MEGLQFRISELLREVKALKSIAREFLDQSTVWSLDQLDSDLSSLSSASDQVRRLRLHPLVTRVSDGEYEPGSRKGGHALKAVVTGAWDVRPSGKRGPSRRLEFCGVASTKIELQSAAEGEVLLATWRMELGAIDSPGCYVHAQVLGDQEDPPFPKSLSIPRLPSLFVTPMGIIEYALGEVFQDGWTKAATADSGEWPFWKELQRGRLERLLRWQQTVVRGGLSSPWMTLKEARPTSDLFI